ERTLVAIAIDGEVKLSRAITGGGRALTLALARSAGIDWQTAEGRKHVADLAPGGSASSVDASWDEDDRTEPGQELPHDDTASLLQALRPQLNSLRTTLINFEDTLKVEVDEVLICGGGAQLAGLRTHLGEALGVPIRKATMPDAAEATAEPLRLALAHALGMKAAKMGSPKALDMRRGELSFQGDLANISLYFRIGGLAAMAILVLGTGWFGYRYVQLSADLAEAESLITSEVQAAFPEMGESGARDPARAVAVVAEETLAATTRVESLGSILSDVPPTLELYRKVVQGMPDHSDARIDVSELTITRTAVSFKAETDGFEEATRIESSLQAVQGFRGAKKGDEKRDRQGNVDFSVTIPLGQQQEDQG
ncbi:MAG: cell division ATPase FtsA, partial [Myxococcota bacterium]